MYDIGMYFQRGGITEGYSGPPITSIPNRTVKELLKIIDPNTAPVPSYMELSPLEYQVEQINSFLNDLNLQGYFKKPSTSATSTSVDTYFGDMIDKLLKVPSITDTIRFIDNGSYPIIGDRDSTIRAHWYLYLLRYYRRYKEFVSLLQKSPFDRLKRAVCTNTTGFLKGYAKISDSYDKIDTTMRSCTITGGYHRKRSGRKRSGRKRSGRKSRKQSKRSTKHRSSRAKKTRRAQ